jgi:hypothetical protein
MWKITVADESLCTVGILCKKAGVYKCQYKEIDNDYYKRLGNKMTII